MISVFRIALCKRCDGGIAQIVVGAGGKGALIAADAGIPMYFCLVLLVKSLRNAYKLRVIEKTHDLKIIGKACECRRKGFRRRKVLSDLRKLLRI